MNVLHDRLRYIVYSICACNMFDTNALEVLHVQAVLETCLHRPGSRMQGPSSLMQVKAWFRNSSRSNVWFPESGHRRWKAGTQHSDQIREQRSI